MEGVGVREAVEEGEGVRVDVHEGELVEVGLLDGLAVRLFDVVWEDEGVVVLDHERDGELVWEGE